MGIHERHRQQRSKNLLLVFALLLFVAAIYGITVLKVGAVVAP